MRMSRRKLNAGGQPYILRDGLQEAEVVMGASAKEATALTAAHQRGVPHGVTAAVVLCRKMRLQRTGTGLPDIFFCNTEGYRALAATLHDGDCGEYPDDKLTEVSSSCHLPDTDAWCNARMRVSVNGRLHAHIERVEITAPVGHIGMHRQLQRMAQSVCVGT